MINWWLVFLGGGLGAVGRYAVSSIVLRNMLTYTFPVATFATNIAGCILFGAVFACAEKWGWFSENGRIFLLTGVLGGFTTFSAFGFELFTLLRRGELLYAALYSVGSLVLGVVGLMLTYVLLKYIVLNHL